VPLPKNFADIIVRYYIPSNFPDCKIIFLGLDLDVAGEAKIAFLKVNFPVFLNAKNYRLDLLILLVVPIANLGYT